jgi:UDP-glucuronate decarboxylase
MNSNYSRPMNLGNPDEYTMEEFAVKIREIVGSQASLEYKDAVIDDPQQRRPDITLAKSRLNWAPHVSLIEGLNKTIEYFRNELHVKNHSERNIYFPNEWLYSQTSSTQHSEL